MPVATDDTPARNIPSGGCDARCGQDEAIVKLVQTKRDGGREIEHIAPISAAIWIPTYEEA